MTNTTHLTPNTKTTHTQISLSTINGQTKTNSLTLSSLQTPVNEVAFTGFYASLRQQTSYAYKSLYQSFACAAFEIWNSLITTYFTFTLYLLNLNSIS